MVQQAQRMNDIPFSSIRKVFEQVDQLKAQGRTIYPYYIGRPNFDTPAHIKEAAKEALDNGLVAYTSNYGLPELREAIADKLFKENHLKVDPDREIIVTVGANEAVLMAMLGLLNPGDEVLIPDPMWLHYFYCAHLAGAKVVSVPLREADGFQLDPDEIAKRITPRTRMIVVNTPHNPTGVVYTRDTLAKVAEIAARYGLYVLSDEIYERIIYDGAEHVSMATFEEIADKTLTVNGFSKSYAMTGWRLGYVAARPEIIGVLVRVHQYTTVCATSFAQAGAIAALRGEQDSIDYMVSEFNQRRRAIVETFEQLQGASLVAPRGAFYAFPNLSALGGTSNEIATRLLEDTGIAVVPGSAFGAFGEGHVRISYACSIEDVRNGMASLTEYWKTAVSVGSQGAT